jgi:hypothetical protein
MSEELIPDTQEETLPAATQQMDMQIADEQEAVSFELALPTYADVTDEKVLKNIRDVFPDFTYDATADFARQFADPKQLVAYVDATMASIKDKQTTGIAQRLVTNGAALAYFWTMGDVVNKTLEAAPYGNGAVGQIAEALHKSVPYVYQIRAVATQLTKQDAYLLGMRDCCSTTTLRKLAQIRDADRRRQIIDIFIQETQDMSDAPRMERAVKAFRVAINEALKRVDAIAQDTTNPTAVVDNEAELVNASYAAAMDALRALRKETRKLSNEEAVCQICDSLADVAVTETVPNAQDWVDRIKEETESVKTQVEAVRGYLDDILRELDSVLHIEVLRNNDTDSELDI